MKNPLLNFIIKKRGVLTVIIVLIFLALVSRAVNELGVDYISSQHEMKNGIIIGAEPIFIDNGNEIGILLIHGFSSSPNDFKKLSEFLAKKNITVYAPLLPGHGTSPRDLKNIRYEEWQDSVQKALNQLNTKKKFILGYSMGGTLTLDLASKNDLDGIIVINSAIFLANRYLPFIPIVMLTQSYTSKKPETIVQLINEDRIVYDVNPLSSIIELEKLIKYLDLTRITEPILIFQSENDDIILPKSADFIYNEVNSQNKELIFLTNSTHTKIQEEDRSFAKVYYFIASASS